MTPANLAKIHAALDLLEGNDSHALRNDRAAEEARNALIGMGARFQRGNTHTLRFAGITGSCAWHDGIPLLRSWRDNARRRLALIEVAE